MWLQLLVPIVLVAVCRMVAVPSGKLRYDYCVIGAGPAGLQMGYFLKRAARDYVILERARNAGEFPFKTYLFEGELLVCGIVCSDWNAMKI